MKIVEAVARAICANDGIDPDRQNRSHEFSKPMPYWTIYANDARAAISVLTPIIQRETAGKCAELALKPVPAQIRNAEDNGWEYGFRMPTYREIYDAIRAAFPPTCAKNAQVAPDHRNLRISHD